MRRHGELYLINSAQRVSRSRENGLQCCTIALVDRLLQFRENGAMFSKLSADRLAIRDAHIAPECRARSSDAREVAKSRTRQRKFSFGVRVCCNLRNQRERQKMRQMAHGREHAVVFSRCHPLDTTSDIPPERFHS